MNNFFFTKLALSNIKKNAPIYVPYIITCVITFAMFYIICFLSLNESMEDIYASGYANRYSTWAAMLQLFFL